MAVYKIFPEKDATMYSRYINMNTGLDEILEMISSIAAFEGAQTKIFFTSELKSIEMIPVIV